MKLFHYMLLCEGFTRNNGMVRGVIIVFDKDFICLPPSFKLRCPKSQKQKYPKSIRGGMQHRQESVFQAAL